MTTTKFANDKGELKRKDSSSEVWITKDGSSGFPAESGRYHLYVSYAYPWAHRTIITRYLKGLTEVISLDVVDYLMGEKGWRFNPETPGATPDSLYGFEHIREVYFLAQKDYEGQFSVPVLWDKKKTIVNNESSEILRMLNSEFNEFCATDEARAVDLYPENLKQEIDGLNEWIYRYVPSQNSSPLGYSRFENKVVGVACPKKHAYLNFWAGQVNFMVGNWPVCLASLAYP